MAILRRRWMVISHYLCLSVRLQSLSVALQGIVWITIVHRLKQSVSCRHILVRLDIHWICIQWLDSSLMAAGIKAHHFYRSSSIWEDPSIGSSWSTIWFYTMDIKFQEDSNRIALPKRSDLVTPSYHFRCLNSLTDWIWCTHNLKRKVTGTETELMWLVWLALWHTDQVSSDLNPINHFKLLNFGKKKFPEKKNASLPKHLWYRHKLWEEPRPNLNHQSYLRISVKKDQ